MVIMLPWESDTTLRKSKHPHPSSQHTPHLTGSKERRKVPSLFHTEKITFISGGDKNVQSKVSFHSSLQWRVLSAEADGTCHCSRGFTWSSLLHQCPLTPPSPPPLLLQRVEGGRQVSAQLTWRFQQTVVSNNGCIITYVWQTSLT